ncbi:MAG TPA: polysaccharide biosynthesis/export family protein [Verrucomicrobiae bacterium]|jgi:polysaccharide export outer membrane protein|nr:polysaccharide biosynthesis/export family protein [Verrucomicrobiae bacterium]
MNAASSKLNPRFTRERASRVLRPSLAVLALAVAMLAFTGCRTQPGPQLTDSQPVVGRPVAPPVAIIDYPGAANYSTNDLHEGDIVRIDFQYSTNFDAEQKVALDGTLNLNMVGRVPVAGKTVTQLQKELTKDYEPFAKGDIITVNLITSGAIVYVSGAVLRPGPMELNHPLTVLEAVMGSGGFDNTRAKLSNVTVLRIVDGAQQAYHINLNRILAGRDPTPFYLQPYDIIYVPAKVFNY